MRSAEKAARRVILAWAVQHDVPVTVRQVELLAAHVATAIEHTEPRLAPVPMRKPGATPDDARRIAARLEACWKRPPGA